MEIEKALGTLKALTNSTERGMKSGYSGKSQGRTCRTFTIQH